jgi:hypothetical protein
MKLSTLKREIRKEDVGQRAFFPYTRGDIDDFGNLRGNTVYMLEVRKPRHLEHHQKLFAIAKCVIANMPESSPWCGKESIQLIKATEIQLGYVDQRIKLNGEIYFEPQHINFESMDQLAFQEFYDKTIPLWAQMIGCTPQELESNSLEYI